MASKINHLNCPLHNIPKDLLEHLEKGVISACNYLIEHFQKNDSSCECLPLKDFKSAKIDSLLKYVIEQNKIKAIKILLKLGFTPNWVLGEGFSLIHYAIMNETKSILEELLRYRANLSYGSGPVAYEALELGLMKDADLSILRLLMSYGLNVNECFKGKPLLHNALKVFLGHPSCLKVTNMILDNGAKPNLQDSCGQTPLHILVIQAGDEPGIAVAQLLLDNQADPNIKDSQGRTVLDLAVSQAVVEGDMDINEILMKRLNGNSTKEMYSIISSTATNNQEVRYQRQYIRESIMKKLILAGAKTTIQKHTGENHLFFLLDYSINQPNSNKEKLDHHLSRSTCDLNECNADGDTPLMYAIKLMLSQKKDLGILNKLLDKGVNVNMPNNLTGETALHICVKGVNQHYGISMIKLLLDKGASPNVQDKLKKTAVHVACDRSQWMDQASTQLRCQALEMLIQPQTRINLVDEEYRSALHFAATSAMIKQVDILVRSGIDVQLRDINGKTAEGLLEKGSEIAKLLQEAPKIQSKIKSFPNPHENTILHICWVIAGHLGHDWRGFVRELKPYNDWSRNNAKIDELEDSHRGKIKEQAYQGMLCWYRNSSNHADINTDLDMILKALESCDRRDIIDILETKFPSVSERNRKFYRSMSSPCTSLQTLVLT